MSVHTRIVVSLLAYFIPAGAIADEAAAPPKPAATAQTDGQHKPPLIVHNPDGTFTVQGNPSQDNAANAGEKGLVIPPQVVVPTVRLPAKAPPDHAR